MINVCAQCGIYRADKTIDPTGLFAICPECGYENPFRLYPLLVVAGASCAGKTSVCRQLTGTCRQAVLLDIDLLWRPEFNQPENDYREFFELWLRMCKNISQSGRPVVLFGAGAGVPGNLEPCIERRYFSHIHYLALVCDADVLSQRLRARPAWRGTQASAFIESQIHFNQWFKDYDASPVIARLDTTSAPLAETAGQVMTWIDDCLAA